MSLSFIHNRKSKQFIKSSALRNLLILQASFVVANLPILAQDNLNNLPEYQSEYPGVRKANTEVPTNNNIARPIDSNNFDTNNQAGNNADKNIVVPYQEPAGQIKNIQYKPVQNSIPVSVASDIKIKPSGLKKIQEGNQVGNPPNNNLPRQGQFPAQGQVPTLPPGNFGQQAPALRPNQIPPNTVNANTNPPTPAANPNIPAKRKVPSGIDGISDAEVETLKDVVEDDNVDQEATAILNVKDAELGVLVKGFSKLAKRNYIVDPGIKGKKVTIHLASEVSLGEALKIFDSLLLLNGFTTVPIGENVWKIIPAKDARQTTIPVLIDKSKSPSDALVTQILRLKYVQSQDLQQLFAPLISKDGAINSFPSTNSLILIDSSANISRLSKIITELDVPAVDQDITIIPILYATAKEIAEKINDIITQDGKDSKGAGGNQFNAYRSMPLGQPQFAGGIAQPSQVNIERRALPIKVIPDERTNSLIVVADEGMTMRVKALVEKLDSKIDLSGGGFYVYRVQHADAEELAKILTQLITGEGSGADTSSTKTTGASSLSSKSTDNKSSSSTKPAVAPASATSRARAAVPPMGGGFFGAGGISNTPDKGRVKFEGEISIAADPATNSLIINASKGDYNRIKPVIEALDGKRRQVVVEASILEVSLDDREGAGVEWQGTSAVGSAGLFAQGKFRDLGTLLSNPSNLSDLTVAAVSSGTLSLPGGIKIPSQAILLKAISNHANVNVLSSPTILATDNQEAQIVVGNNVPFVTSTSTNQTNLQNTFNQIERQDVGIKLKLTPQISAGDSVLLKLFLEISSVKEGTETAANGPITTIRTTETQAEVRSGQMIVTGGLIQDQVGGSSNGVPFLKDIPFLGQLFRSDVDTRSRNNLLVFLTPKIIHDQYDARDDAKERISEVEQIIKKNKLVPSRKEFLHSKELDRVTEGLEDPSGLPTTQGVAVPQLGLIKNKTITRVRVETVPNNISKNAEKKSKDLQSFDVTAEDIGDFEVESMSPTKPVRNIQNKTNSDSRSKARQRTPRDGDLKDTLEVTVSPELPSPEQKKQLLGDSPSSN